METTAPTSALPKPNHAIVDRLNTIVSVIYECTEHHRDPLYDTPLGTERANLSLSILKGNPLPKVPKKGPAQFPAGPIKDTRPVTSKCKYAYRLYELLTVDCDVTRAYHFNFSLIQVSERH
jgi:hypothetical protein